MQNCRAKKNSGFTLMEVIMVVVVLGILAAMALPRFGTITPTAADANAKAIAGALGVAAANYNANCSVGVGSCTTLTCTTAMALLSGITVSDYTVGGSPASGCTVMHIKGSTTYTSATLLP
ncbi:MAG: type II secretion system protein [Magnetococcales bacterium]|nr:type II secretion system protein [Magnetococcales bacterium]